jgi:glutamine synthetase
MDTNRLDTEELRRDLAAQGVRFVFAQFTDIHGAAKGKLIPLTHLDDIVSPGAGFSGPSIWGTGLPRNGPRSEYYGRADLETLQPMPWLPGYARVALNGHVAGQSFDACPRQVLRKQVARLAAHCWTRAFLDRLTTSLDQCGLGVFQIDHEDATGQFEVNYNYTDALKAAGNFMLFKMAAHHIAEEEGMLFSMMPKPFADRPGSGLRHAPALTALCAIAAGLDGIENKMEAQRAELGLKLLPQNLGEAAAALKADTVLENALGENLVKEFVALKSGEWIEYSQHVSAWETARYLERF